MWAFEASAWVIVASMCDVAVSGNAIQMLCRLLKTGKKPKRSDSVAVHFFQVKVKK